MGIPYKDYHIGYDIEKGEIKGRPLYTLTRYKMNPHKGRRKQSSAPVSPAIPASDSFEPDDDLPF